MKLGSSYGRRDDRDGVGIRSTATDTMMFKVVMKLMLKIALPSRQVYINAEGEQWLFVYEKILKQSGKGD